MKLLTHIAIRNFRSIRQVDLVDLDSYVPIIGPNGSGKSNVFRALSLFFNGYLDEAKTPLDLARDFPDTAKKRRHQVVITVTFDLSDGYDVRDARTVLAAAGVTDVLVVERSWSYAPGGSTVQDQLRFGIDQESLRLPDSAQLVAIQSLIRSVGFRYVPNHIRPAELIRTEIAPLQQTLMSRLRKTKEYRAGKLAETMSALQRVAGGMLGTLLQDVAAGTGQLRGVGADVPKDFSELALKVALNAISASGTIQRPEVQGSGTQTFILLHVLALLDSTLIGQGFGWRQSSVWAFEEPESFLHAGLRLRFAEDLRRFADDPRRQIFLTTHQDEFVRLSDNAWLTDLREGATQVARVGARDALERTNRQLVTTYRHPLLLHPDEPIVLVEGPFDYTYLRAAIISAGRRPRWRLVSIEDLEAGRSGGDAILAWLKGNGSALRSRPETAPVLVLRDWDDTMGPRFDAALKEHEWSRSFICPEALVNPDLDETFRGIERFLSTDFVRGTLGSTVRVPAGSTVPLGIRPKDYPSAKQALHAEFEKGTGPAGSFLVGLVEWLDDQVTAQLNAIPPGAFAPT